MIRALIRRLLGKPAETVLERHERQHGRANRANADYVAAKAAETAMVAEVRSGGRPRRTRRERCGIGDLPRPIYPARQTVWLEGDMSKQAQPWLTLLRTCAWSLEPCTEPAAEYLGLCVAHMRRVYGAATPEVTS